MPGLSLDTNGNSMASPAVVGGAGTDSMLLEAAERVLRSGRSLSAFGPELEARFEKDTGPERVRQLRSVIPIGLVVLNLYAVTGFITVPDWASLNATLRLIVVTPIGLLILWASAWTSGRVREALCAAGILGANCVPILLIALENGVFVYLCAAEIMLSVIFGNVVVPLRYPWACAVSAVTAALVTAALISRVGFGPEVGAVVVLDVAVAIGFTLIANRRTEAANRSDYLRNLSETLRGKRLAEDNTVLARLSATDALTGLANRRRFMIAIDDLWRSVGHAGDFALIFLDVDHFKRFNDRYGHGAGDACLQTIADILARHATGPSDLASRHGGEEFAVLLPGRTMAQALDIAEFIRVAVAERAVPHANRDDGIDSVTISLGVATSAGAGSSAALIEAADRALYAAKAEGRNRTYPSLASTRPRGTGDATALPIDSGCGVAAA